MVPSAGQCQESNWAALLTEHPLGSCPELQAGHGREKPFITWIRTGHQHRHEGLELGQFLSCVASCSPPSFSHLLVSVTPTNIPESNWVLGPDG